jgi:hypothetical protein
MAAHGRGPDDRLVHMSGKEVAGLQALAQAHGGSLTRNPQTGLPEAGFLDDILPVALGAAAMYFTGGAAAPWIEGVSNAALIGGGVGALQTARTGDLGKGIMAGLGAYGGAGMAGAAEGAGLLGGSSPQAVTTQVPQAVPTLTPDAGLSSGSSAMDASLGQTGFTSTPTSYLPDNIDIGGGFNPASNGTAIPTPAGPAWGNVIASNGKYAMAAAAPAAMSLLSPKTGAAPQGTEQMIRPYTFASNGQSPTNMVGTKYMPGQDTSERQWFQPTYTAGTPYKAASGGLMDLASMAAGGGPVENMSNQAALGENTMYPMANMTTSAFATPYQDPRSSTMIAPSGGGSVNQMTGEPNPQGTRLASGGGISALGGYSDGGRLLKGPGDGMSDNIPAQIGEKQPARLADGEFVVPADVVSHLGNGSTDAGAKQLYNMMDKIRQARTGRKAQGKQIKPSKFMPA